MRIYVLGSGYVGLTTAAVLARAHEVHCFDVQPERIAQLRRGDCPIFEAGLPERLGDVAGFHEASELAEVVQSGSGAAIYIIATQTPQSPSGSTDMSYVDAAVTAVTALASIDDVVIKSTVPPASLARWPGISTWPEFLREGTAIQDSLTPDRTIVGGPAAQKVLDVIAPIVDPGQVLCYDDPRTPMLVKYASNAFLATKISFINEVARLCDVLGVDVSDVAAGVGSDSRIGPDFLRAGLGWGGSCFPKDTRSMLAQAREQLVDLGVVASAIDANDKQRSYVFAQIEKLRRRLDLPRCASVYGLAFKPGTDDVRESLQVELVERLVCDGWLLSVDDPAALAMFSKRRVADLVTVGHRPAPLTIIGTEWPEYTGADFARRLVERGVRAVFDCRNCLTAEARAHLASSGVTYQGVGR